MRTIWQDTAVQEVRSRIATLSPDTTARWGRMNVQQAVVHMADQLRCALGEKSAAPVRTPVRYSPLRDVVVWWLPWPKGVATIPELRDPVTGEWDADRARLEALIDRCVARGANSDWTPHPAFGKLSGRAWGRLMYRHLDHHLRQFGA